MRSTGTYKKKHLLATVDRLTFLDREVFSKCRLEPVLVISDKDIFSSSQLSNEL